jgi:cation diffusion facilitator family transporter
MGKFNWSDDGYFPTEKRDLKRIRTVLIATMLLNFLATGIKLAAGLATGALSVVADSLDSLFDGLSNVVGLAGLYASAKPPDAGHPYGYRKFETIAALSIAFLLFITCWQLFQTAWRRLGSEVAPQINVFVIAAMVLAMVIQAITSVYELREGRRLNSEILVADALHTRASILVSFSVLAGLLLVRLGYPKADPLVAMFVAVMIAKIGIDILRETLPVLVDQAPIDPQIIANIVRSVAGIESFHRVRSRGARGSVAVDLHIRVAPERTVQEADAIASELRRRLLDQEGISDVTVHMEAQHITNDSTQDIFATLKQLADQLGVTIHESWAHKMDEELYIEVHVGVNPAITLGQAHTLVDQLENELRRRHPEIKEVHTHIEMASHQIEEGDHVSQAFEEMVLSEIQQVVNDIPEIGYPHHVIVRNSKNGGGYHVSLECTIAADTPVIEAHRIAEQLEHELTDRLPDVLDVFVHLEPPEWA